VIFNRAVPYEVPHMILAAYLVTGFLVASVYAVGCCAGRRDRYHRLGLLIPQTVAAAQAADPVRGRRHRRARDRDRPADQVRRMECVQRPRRHVTEYIYGRCTSTGVKGGSASRGSTPSSSASAPIRK
jgi:cytochrome d ubiquinol oxidase subunit I